MDQMSFGDAEYAHKKKRTRREIFLAEMEQIEPWKELVKLLVKLLVKRRLEADFASKSPFFDLNQTNFSISAFRSSCKSDGNQGLR